MALGRTQDDAAYDDEALDALTLLSHFAALAVHIIITNGLESLWMRGFEMLWIVFVILAAEAARYWKAAPARVPSLRARAWNAWLRGSAR